MSLTFNDLLIANILDYYAQSYTLAIISDYYKRRLNAGYYAKWDSKYWDGNLHTAGGFSAPLIPHDYVVKLSQDGIQYVLKFKIFDGYNSSWRSKLNTNFYIVYYYDQGQYKRCIVPDALSLAVPDLAQIMNPNYWINPELLNWMSQNLCGSTNWDFYWNVSRTSSTGLNAYFKHYPNFQDIYSKTPVLIPKDNLFLNYSLMSPFLVDYWVDAMIH